MLVSLLIISLKAHFGEAIDCHWDQNIAAQGRQINNTQGVYKKKTLHKDQRLLNLMNHSKIYYTVANNLN
jgi:hypothetical protein